MKKDGPGIIQEMACSDRVPTRLDCLSIGHTIEPSTT
ncbi:hypothetical protein LCGC14_2550200, partial [marine sediment metagenome]